MTFPEFQQSIARDRVPPPEMAPAVQALWHDARGDWDAAHGCAQNDHSPAGSWVHAYLHRKEGDDGNAGYWYARARRTPPAKGTPLEAEWAAIATDLLGR